MNSTKVSACTCHHDYQDCRYGKQKRLHVGCGTDSRGQQGRFSGHFVHYKCTVCNKEKRA